MIEEIDYTEIPYIQEILNFLPINPEDEEDVINYIQNITNLIAVNYKYGQYQFAYFGIHLLYMTYVYCVAWKISQIEPDRYKDAIVFARPYNGRERDFKIEDADSIFSYSLMPEKEIAKLFRIIGLDKSQISVVSNLVEMRNEMAHEAIIKGDAKSISIGAASIIAKVTRDRLMVDYDTIYPEYGFASNKGYGAKAHIDALKKYGPTPIHRKSFIKNL